MLDGSSERRASGNSPFDGSSSAGKETSLSQMLLKHEFGKSHPRRANRADGSLIASADAALQLSELFGPPPPSPARLVIGIKDADHPSAEVWIFQASAERSILLRRMGLETDRQRLEATQVEVVPKPRFGLFQMQGGELPYQGLESETGLQAS